MFDVNPSAVRADSRNATTARPAFAPAPMSVFKPDQTIFTAGDRPGGIYYVAYGIVRIYRVQPGGRRQICAFHMPGEIFGFESGAERHFSAEAITATGLYPLRSDADVPLSQQVLGQAMSSVNQAHDHILTLGHPEAVNRVASFLLEMIERQHASGDTMLDLPMTRADIADYLGLTLESVSRGITRLRERGLIRLRTARRIDILRRDALAALAE